MRKYSLTKYGFMKIKNTDIAAEISCLSEKKDKTENFILTE